MDRYQIPLEVKSIDENGQFSGYASVFHHVDSQKDMVVEGAFVGATEHPEDIKFLWQHKMEEPIGVIRMLVEDEHGLYVEGELLLDVERAREAYALLKSGAVNGLSIGYRVVDAALDLDTGVRLLKEIDLLEISLVTFPANDIARVHQVKQQLPKSKRELEATLRDAGLSRSQAKAVLADGYKSEDKSRDANLSEDEKIEFERVLDHAILSLTT